MFSSDSWLAFRILQSVSFVSARHCDYLLFVLRATIATDSDVSKRYNLVELKASQQRLVLFSAHFSSFLSACS